MATTQTAPGRTIREAIGVALEGLSGDLLEWVVLAKQRDAMRSHVIRFVHDFARTHGVLLSDSDITSELDAVIAELKGKVVEPTPAPRLVRRRR